MTKKDISLENVILRLDKDLKNAARDLADDEARHLVNTYYQMQKDRIRSQGQLRALETSGEPSEVFFWLTRQREILEERVKQALRTYCENDKVGDWLLDQVGVGPVIAAGLRANIDIDEAPTVGHIWSYAGLNDEQMWLSSAAARGVRAFVDDPKAPLTPEKIVTIAKRLGGSPKWLARRAYRMYREGRGEDGYIPFGNNAPGMDDLLYIQMIWDGVQPTIDDVILGLSKRPWNAELKTICWKLGQSLVKNQNRQDAYYGKFIRERKKTEIMRNMNGELASRAAKLLGAKNIGKTTTAYKFYSGQLPPEVWIGFFELDTNAREKRITELLLPVGKGVPMLPPGHIQARVERWVTKLFLSHLHEFWWKTARGSEPPKPYALTMEGHAHYIPIPEKHHS